MKKEYKWFAIHTLFLNIHLTNKIYVRIKQHRKNSYKQLSS